MKFCLDLTSSAIQERELAKTLPFYGQVAAKVDAELNKLSSSQEALNSSVFGRALVAIVDTFTGIANTFVTNITKFNQVLKRSELEEFVASNKLKCSTVTGIPYAKVQDIAVDVPTNMSTTFEDAIDGISKLQRVLNAAERSKIAVVKLTEIFKQITNKQDATQLIIDFSTLVTTNDKEVKSAVFNCQRQFKNNAATKKVFKEVYTSMKEFTSCTDQLIALTPYLKNINVIKTNIKTMEGYLRGISDNFETNEEMTVTTRMITSFGESLKSLALVFDAAQLASTRQMALEHNHILNINAAYSLGR